MTKSSCLHCISPYHSTGLHDLIKATFQEKRGRMHLSLERRNMKEIWGASLLSLASRPGLASKLAGSGSAPALLQRAAGKAGPEAGILGLFPGPPTLAVRPWPAAGLAPSGWWPASHDARPGLGRLQGWLPRPGGQPPTMCAPA